MKFVKKTKFNHGFNGKQKYYILNIFKKILIFFKASEFSLISIYDFILKIFLFENISNCNMTIFYSNQHFSKKGYFLFT